MEHALCRWRTLKPGATVLQQGTGGLSIITLQLARAAGLRAIITSSSDEKLQRARALGADDTIDYRTSPEWHDEVLRLTDGRGVDLIELIREMRRLSGIFVGIRVMLEDLILFLSTTKIHPIIDREYSFSEAPLACEYLQSGRHLGKVVIRVAS